MSHECKNNNNHNGITIVDDYILEKPHIKQNYMGSGVPFHPNSIPIVGHKNTLPIPLVGIPMPLMGSSEVFYKNIKYTFK
jgi:hypothetical protein